MGIKLTHFFFSWLITCTNNPNTPLHFGPTVPPVCRITADGASAGLPSPSATAAARWKDDSGTLVSVNLWMHWGLRCFHFHTFENSDAQYIKSSKGVILCVDRGSRRDKEINSIRWRNDISCSILSNTATELIVIIDPVLHSELCSVLISLFPCTELRYFTGGMASFLFYSSSLYREECKGSVDTMGILIGSLMQEERRRRSVLECAIRCAEVRWWGEVVVPGTPDQYFFARLDQTLAKPLRTQWKRMH